MKAYYHLRHEGEQDRLAVFLVANYYGDDEKHPFYRPTRAEAFIKWGSYTFYQSLPDRSSLNTNSVITSYYNPTEYHRSALNISLTNGKLWMFVHSQKTIKYLDGDVTLNVPAGHNEEPDQWPIEPRQVTLDTRDQIHDFFEKLIAESGRTSLILFYLKRSSRFLLCQFIYPLGRLVRGGYRILKAFPLVATCSILTAILTNIDRIIANIVRMYHHFHH